MLKILFSFKMTSQTIIVVQVMHEILFKSSGLRFVSLFKEKLQLKKKSKN